MNTIHRYSQNTFAGGAEADRCCLPPLTRDERAGRAKVAIGRHFNSKQQAFLDFVLAHYVVVGVDELDQEKLTPLLRLRYRNSIADAIADLSWTASHMPT